MIVGEVSGGRGDRDGCAVPACAVCSRHLNVLERERERDIIYYMGTVDVRCLLMSLIHRPITYTTTKDESPGIDGLMD